MILGVEISQSLWNYFGGGLGILGSVFGWGIIPSDNFPHST